MPARCDDLGLESVGGDEAREVVDEVQADRLDAARGGGDRLFGGETLPDGGPLILAAIGEDAVEDLIEGLPDDLKLRQPALVEDRHRRAVLDRLLDGVGVDIGAEGAQRASVLPVYGGAGEAEEAGVGQGLAHVRGEAPVLRAVGFVHHHEDVLGLGQGGVGRSPPCAAAGSGDLLELLDRGHHRLAGRVHEDSPEIPHAVRTFGVRKSAGLEHPGDLPVELGAVCDDDHGGLALRLVAAELEREPEHRQALSRALRVPDDPASRARLSGTANPPHRFVDGDELAVAGELADLAASVAVEHHEVPHQVEEVPRLEEPEEQNVLRRRRAPKLLVELLHRQGIGLLPREEEALGGADRAVHGALAAGGDEDLRTVSKSFGAPRFFQPESASW